jgi:hypothetical protein
MYLNLFVANPFSKSLTKMKRLRKLLGFTGTKGVELLMQGTPTEKESLVL